MVIIQHNVPLYKLFLLCFSLFSFGEARNLKEYFRISKMSAIPTVKGNIPNRNRRMSVEPAEIKPEASPRAAAFGENSSQKRQRRFWEEFQRSFPFMGKLRAARGEASGFIAAGY